MVALPKMCSCRHVFRRSRRLCPPPFRIWDPSRLLSHSPPSRLVSDIVPLSMVQMRRNSSCIHLLQSASGYWLFSAYGSLAVPARELHTCVPRILSADSSTETYGTTLGIGCRDKDSHTLTCNDVVPDHSKLLRNFSSRGGHLSQGDSEWWETKRITGIRKYFRFSVFFGEILLLQFMITYQSVCGLLMEIC